MIKAKTVALFFSIFLIYTSFSYLLSQRYLHSRGMDVHVGAGHGKVGGSGARLHPEECRPRLERGTILELLPVRLTFSGILLLECYSCHSVEDTKDIIRNLNLLYLMILIHNYKVLVKRSFLWKWTSFLIYHITFQSYEDEGKCSGHPVGLQRQSPLWPY